MKYDIVIIGAGPAGLSFARSLGETSLKVLLVERSSLTTLREPPEDGREIALTHLSVEMMKASGAWQQLADKDVSPICAAKVLDGNSSYTLDFDNDDADLDALGYLVPNDKIRKAYFEVVEGIDNVELLTETSVEEVGSGSDSAWVILSNGERVECDLLVSADSRFSETRRKMGVPATMKDFSRTAIVCRMEHTLPHNQTAFECFHYGRTLAILPMTGNLSSIVVTVSSAEADTIFNMSEEAFAADIEQRLQGQLGSMKLYGRRHLYPLVAVHANKFIGRRFAVIGDAAVGMHPVTAHGFNLGLRSQETLTKEIKQALSKGMDIGSYTVLEKYQSNHMRVTKPLYMGTNLVVGLFTNDNFAAKIARKATLRIANNFSPLKQVITRKLTEKRIDIPFFLPGLK
ncbi:Ubiquinone biosynthesis hydroxylase, UbiH/UbiF/VisC/COQ6 family [Amphritea atlantica]|uniref:Ubiquinone biosynthesis hydroxylase, UbiH/UbiF/VisC/COQ6 family n=1 Tax=Amphritea atlantica TaxID=355243 RepID=A0A1H9LI62_9GAMM|nr:5-demethoxyubiquinol-8 5-hydroxylase UbiM [Amphritea atlantica]SER11201.1 Ubiquinone biosynthesis hydroxylase, UbiH/UbiF/VisC/COQ6 family [Amphritea atlantica]